MKACELAPEALLFENNLGVARLNLKRPAEAASAFRRVLELHTRSFSTAASCDASASPQPRLAQSSRVALPSCEWKAPSYSRCRGGKGCG